MYKSLEEKMLEKGVTQAEIADFLNRRRATISDKVRGKFPFTLEEARIIRDKFFPDCTIEDLFSVENENSRPR